MPRGTHRPAPSRAAAIAALIAAIVGAAKTKPVEGGPK